MALTKIESKHSSLLIWTNLLSLLQALLTKILGTGLQELTIDKRDS